MATQLFRTGEFETIDRYFAPLTEGFDGAHNLANDTANLTIMPGNDAVVTLDTLVSGVHFLPDDPPDLVARKLLRVNLSDLASSGAVPRAYFLSMSLPSDTTEDWIARFAEGLAADQASFGVKLGGGDTTSTPGPLSLSLTAIGEAPRDDIILRSGAAPGDDIYVSGTIGDGALALALIEKSGFEKAQKQAPGLIARYRIPEPRVTLGPRLRGLATAAIDVSDGLLADLGHICGGSSVGARITASSVPRSEEARNLLASEPDFADRLYWGGDDYELLFTADPEDADRIFALSRDLAVPLTRIGTTVAGDRAELLSDTGAVMDLPATGWRHF